MKIGANDISKIMLGSAEVDKIYLGTEQVYGGEPTPPHDYSQDYLTIESLESSNTIYFKAFATGLTKTISASTDNGVTWRSYTSSTGGSGTAIATLGTGGKVLLKGLNSSYGNLSNGVMFASTKTFNTYGNIMSMASGDTFINATTLTDDYSLPFLFYNCSGLVSAENLILPATTMTAYCYRSMFYGCTSLTAAPVLPATTMAEGCYQGMFNGCTSLTSTPQLPATTLAYKCYRIMFKGCTSLTTAHVLPATTLASNCYTNMFDGCTSLTTAPELPATILQSDCYNMMFLDCTSLSYIKCLATDISAIGCTDDWVYNVAASGTFVKAASMLDWTNGVSGIPTGWTVQNDDGSPYSNNGTDYGGDDPV